MIGSVLDRIRLASVVDAAWKVNFRTPLGQSGEELGSWDIRRIANQSRATFMYRKVDTGVSFAIVQGML